MHRILAQGADKKGQPRAQNIRPAALLGCVYIYIYIYRERER